MRRFRCNVVLSEDLIREGKVILKAGSPVYHTYRVAREASEELASEILAEKPPGWESFALSTIPLKVVFEEFPEETATTPAKLLAMPRQETPTWELEESMSAFMGQMTGYPWEGDALDFEEDCPIQVHYRYRGRPNYFVEVISLEWNGTPFALLVGLTDDRKYHRHITVVIDRALANQAIHCVLDARIRAMAREIREQIQEEALSQESGVVEGDLNHPLVLFDAHGLVCVDNTIQQEG